MLHIYKAQIFDVDLPFDDFGMRVFYAQNGKGLFSFYLF